MDFKDAYNVVKGGFSNLNDRQKISELENAVKYFEGMVEEEEDGETRTTARYRIACLALRLQQQTIPMLNGLAEKALDFAGPKAVQEACKPYTVPSGREMRSEFKLPEKFGGVVEKVKDAARTLLGA